MSLDKQWKQPELPPIDPSCNTVVCLPVQNEPLFLRNFEKATLQDAELGLLQTLLRLRSQVAMDHNELLHAHSYEVILIVNNSQSDVDENNAVYRSNQRTLRFLHAMAEGDTETTNAMIDEEVEDDYDRESFRMLTRSVSECLRLRILDKSSDGRAFEECNVGIARDYAGQHAAKRLMSINRPNGLIMFVDADGLYSNFYINAFQKEFLANPGLVVAEGNRMFIHLTPCAATARFDVMRAVEQCSMTIRNKMIRIINEIPEPPTHEGWFSGASITTNAKSFLEVGGVPHLPGGEDTCFSAALSLIGEHTQVKQAGYVITHRFSDRVDECCGWGHRVEKQAQRDSMITSSNKLAAEIHLESALEQGLPYEMFLTMRPDLFVIPRYLYDILLENAPYKNSPGLEPKRFYTYLHTFKQKIGPILEEAFPPISPQEAAASCHELISFVLGHELELTDLHEIPHNEEVIRRYTSDLANIFGDIDIPEAEYNVNITNLYDLAGDVVSRMDIGPVNHFCIKTIGKSLLKAAQSWLSKRTRGLIKEPDCEYYRNYLNTLKAFWCRVLMDAHWLPREPANFKLLADLKSFLHDEVAQHLITLRMADNDPAKAMRIYGQINGLIHGCEDAELRESANEILCQLEFMKEEFGK